MFNFVKLLTLVTLFKDVTSKVQESGVDGRPWYYHRTAWGAILTGIGTVASTLFGVKIDTENLNLIADGIPQLISVGITAWGVALTTVGAGSKVIKAVSEKKEG